MDFAGGEVGAAWIRFGNEVLVGHALPKITTFYSCYVVNARRDAAPIFDRVSTIVVLMFIMPETRHLVVIACKTFTSNVLRKRVKAPT